MLSNVGLLLFLAALTVLPVKLAAGFVGAERDTWLVSALAAVVGTVTAVIGYKIAGGNIPGLAVGFLALLVSYAVLLKTSLGGAFGLAFVALLIQIAVVTALYSAGFATLKTVLSQ